ncbi:MAG TPA: glutamate-5-semialdehyde dehydrogenase [Candidatus Saccharimonadales bacterium]|nr:glutamate-5-semialdehyde dehydrogenase [Candidatus Saccharimonadales bacterium]
MKNNLLDHILKQTKEASSSVAKLDAKQKKALLLTMADTLINEKSAILAANKKDIELTKKKKATSAFIDRLTLTEKGFQGMVDQLRIVANLPDYIGEIIEEKTLLNNIDLVKKRFPLGVILMIYESRPNVTVDVAGICLKSGNAVILKGGTEAQNTNKAIITCLHAVLEKYALPLASITFLENISHQEIHYLLRQKQFIDVVIPRGSYLLTTSVAKHARIPILYHSAGGARMYIDKSANVQASLKVFLNAKTQRTGVCNALDVVLVHKDIAYTLLPLIDKELYKKQFEVRADKEAKKYMPHAKNAHARDFKTEFLDSILAVKVVDDANQAINFIKNHTHGHTEIIMSEDREMINSFISEVDAAGLMINCSSRIHDGGEFGMGAEMGTATGKLHARGPVGVRELTTYKWIAYGNGQVRE